MVTEVPGLTPGVTEQPARANSRVAQDVEAGTRAFLIKFIALFSALLLLLAGGLGLATNRYEFIAVIWAVTGPIFGALTSAYLGTPVGARSAQVSEVVTRLRAPTDAEPKVAVDAQSADLGYGRRRVLPHVIQVRTLSAGVWTAVAILLAAAVTVAIGALTAPRSDPWLLGVPFLATLGMAMMGWLWADQHVRRRSLAQMARAGQRQTRILQDRSALLMGEIERRQMQRR